ncbi:MAG: nucleotidyl transferase AbiEii/AbiGii toxin family protein [Anaerolineae bacterium]|nr:nucleotidyl transferase AbiEii/AbiGii toxin family protein [Anaerolineae bacterium]
MDEPVLLPPQRRPVLVSPFPALQPVVLSYALEEILAEKMRSILQRGKARDYYDVWRLLKEKAGDLNIPLARSLLARKCRHKGLIAPDPAPFLLPERLAEAEAYWERDLSDQIAGGLIPDWKVVVGELAEMLGTFFRETACE